MDMDVRMKAVAIGALFLIVKFVLFQFISIIMFFYFIGFFEFC
jgi:hypothetical protein